MKIKEISITNYGPLPKIESKLDNFNLIYGENEIGKTFLMDALIRLMFGKDVQKGQKYHRVEARPSGYVLISDNNEEVKAVDFKIENYISKITGLESDVCENLFIIHNSNLEINDSQNFFDQLTSKLTGIKTQPLLEIKDNLLNDNFLTDTGDFKNTKGDDKKLKDRISGAKRLIKNINKKEKDSQDFKNLEFDLAKKKIELNEITAYIKELDNARNRERYEKGKAHLESFEEISVKLKELENINSVDKDLWNTSLSALNTYKEQKEGLNKNLEEKKEESLKIKEEIEENNGKLEEISQKYNELGLIKAKLNEIQTKKAKIDSFNKNYNLLIRFLVIFSVLLASSIISVAIFANTLTVAVTAASGIGFLMFFGILLKNYMDKMKYSESFELLKNNLAKIGIFNEELNEILYEIEEIERNHNLFSSKFTELSRDFQHVENIILDLRNVTIPEIEGKISGLIEKINVIKNKATTNNLQEYIKKLNQKSNLETQYQVHLIGLTEILKVPDKDSTIEAKLEFWTLALEGFEIYKDKALDINWTTELSNRTNLKKEEISNEINVLEKKLRDFEAEIKNFESRCNEIFLKYEEHVKCEKFDDMSNLSSKLENFMEKWNTTKRLVNKTYEILNKIETQERKKIAEIFNDELLKTTFAQITHDRYTDIKYNPDKDKIMVVNYDGLELPAQNLSSATLDQLYFSIRLAFSKKVLSDRMGFFILDDPFIKSDINRLHEKLGMLMNLSKEGWQILYFSAKLEVMDYFKDNNLLKSINLITIGTKV